MIKIDKSKFNVDKKVEQRTYNDIIFDSKLEMKYYRDVLLPMLESGELTKIELQKKYVLQDAFERNGKKVLPINYVADFYIEFSDGRTQVIDTKGMPDNVSRLKRKLFWHRYPETDYIWISYSKKYGGWGSYDEHEYLRKLDRRNKKGLKEKKNGKGKENGSN